MYWYNILKRDFTIPTRGKRKESTRKTRKEKMSAEEFLAMKKKKAEGTAEQLLTNIINDLDYITREGDKVIIKPKWLAAKSEPYRLGPYTGNLTGKGIIRDFWFDWGDIHEGFCIYINVKREFYSELSRRTKELDYSSKRICITPELSPDPFKQWVMADNYTTPMLMARTEEDWKTIWK